MVSRATIEHESGVPDDMSRTRSTASGTHARPPSCCCCCCRADSLPPGPSAHSFHDRANFEARAAVRRARRAVYDDVPESAVDMLKLGFGGSMSHRVRR